MLSVIPVIRVIAIMIVFTQVTAEAALSSFTDRRIATDDRILCFVNYGGFPVPSDACDYTYVPMSRLEMSILLNQLKTTFLISLTSFRHI